MSDEDIHEVVKETYAAAVRAALSKEQACGTSCGSPPVEALLDNPITRALYSATDVEGMPDEAVRASFGCGNPSALADLGAGEVVLDLGSGAGIDVLLSARRVGPTGKAYGLDMTPEMLAAARANQAAARAVNVEFLLGTLENIPLPDASVDVVISNCVINLTPDKRKVLAEAFRVLRPGGRFAVADVVLQREVPGEVRAALSWSGCLAGALLMTEYESQLADAGFSEVTLEPLRVYDRAALEEMMASGSCCGGGQGTVVTTSLEVMDGALMSAFVRARKPSPT